MDDVNEVYIEADFCSYSQPLLVHHPLDSDCSLLRVQLTHSLKQSRYTQCYHAVLFAKILAQWFQVFSMCTSAHVEPNATSPLGSYTLLKPANVPKANKWMHTKMSIENKVVYNELHELTFQICFNEVQYCPSVLLHLGGCHLLLCYGEKNTTSTYLRKTLFLFPLTA